jgi:hypothetical protein
MEAGGFVGLIKIWYCLSTSCCTAGAKPLVVRFPDQDRMKVPFFRIKSQISACRYPESIPKSITQNGPKLSPWISCRTGTVCISNRTVLGGTDHTRLSKRSPDTRCVCILALAQPVMPGRHLTDGVRVSVQTRQSSLQRTVAIHNVSSNTNRGPIEVAFTALTSGLQ